MINILISSMALIPIPIQQFDSIFNQLSLANIESFLTENE